MGKQRLVDTWFYDVKDLEIEEIERKTQGIDEEEEDEEKPEVRKRLITKKVEIKVHMEKETVDEGGAPYMLKDIKFIVSCLEPKFEYQGTDIEALRTAAFSHLGEHFEIKWEKYFLVRVGHATDYGGGLSTGLTFSYNDVEKGTTWNHQELLRQFAWRGEREIKPWPGAFTDKNGTAIACIPATEANEDALKEFFRRINVLREMIRDTIKPEVILNTLANLSKLALLPPAPAEAAEDEEAEIDEKRRYPKKLT